MKKKYFIFIIILSIFIFPKDTFAYTLYPNNVYSYSPDNSSYDFSNSIEHIQYNSIDFWGPVLAASTPSSLTGLGFKYIPSAQSSEAPPLNKNYNVQFTVITPNIYSRYLNPLTATIRNSDGSLSSCTVQSNYDAGYNVLITGNNYGGSLFSSTVYCENFYLHEDSFTILLSGPIFYTNKSYVAISRVTLDPHSKYDIINAIEDNSSSLSSVTEATKDQTDTIKDSNVNESTENANSFFKDFKSDDYGLSDVVVMPLSFIKNLSNNKCNDLNVPLPFVDKDVKISCMTPIYQTYFGPFLSLYQIITTGIISYWVCVNIFRLVQNFKNPDNDEIEVMDL